LAEGRSLEFASCQGGWGAHVKKRPNLKRWQI